MGKGDSAGRNGGGWMKKRGSVKEKRMENGNDDEEQVDEGRVKERKGGRH